MCGPLGPVHVHLWMSQNPSCMNTSEWRSEEKHSRTPLRRQAIPCPLTGRYHLSVWISHRHREWWNTNGKSCREKCEKGWPVDRTSYPFPPLFPCILHWAPFPIMILQGWDRPIVLNLTTRIATSWVLIFWPVEEEEIDLEREPNEENRLENDHQAYPYDEVLVREVIAEVCGWIAHPSFPTPFWKMLEGLPSSHVCWIVQSTLMGN